jgi:hypothetical protein
VESTSLNTYGYDAVGNRTSETKQSSSKTITLTTDASGQTSRSESAVTTGQAATTVATFDNLNQLKTLTKPNGNGTILSSFDYDNNGNL